MVGQQTGKDSEPLRRLLLVCHQTRCRANNNQAALRMPPDGQKHPNLDGNSCENIAILTEGATYNPSPVSKTGAFQKNRSAKASPK